HRAQQRRTRSHARRQPAHDRRRHAAGDARELPAVGRGDASPEARGADARLRRTRCRGARRDRRVPGRAAMSFDPQRTQPPDAEAQAARLLTAWETPAGFRYFSEVNNSAVGIWYTSTALAFLLFGGVLALLMRIQLAVPENTFLTADQYNQIFTMHGTVMMFLFAVPIFEAISVLLLPALLGARDLPFPRLSAYGYWSFLIGGAFVSGSLFFGAAPRGGWFMYPPLTSSYDMGIGADIWLLGLSFIEIAAIAAAVELIVGIQKFRPPGMRINLMPL